MGAMGNAMLSLSNSSKQGEKLKHFQRIWRSMQTDVYGIYDISREEWGSARLRKKVPLLRPRKFAITRSTFVSRITRRARSFIRPKSKKLLQKTFAKITLFAPKRLKSKYFSIYCQLTRSKLLKPTLWEKIKTLLKHPRPDYLMSRYCLLLKHAGRKVEVPRRLRRVARKYSKLKRKRSRSVKANNKKSKMRKRRGLSLKAIRRKMRKININILKNFKKFYLKNKAKETRYKRLRSYTF